MRRAPLIYRQLPVFGFDLGTRTVKVLQLSNATRPKIIGYGHADFPEDAVVEGIIVDPDLIVSKIAGPLRTSMTGRIAARRVAAALPVSRVFTRTLSLPPMATSDLAAAVRLEAEQYVPVPLPDLYIDYEVIEQTPEHSDILMVAAPRAIVDSYMQLFDRLGLEPVCFESSLSAVTRAIVATTPLSTTTLVADFGSSSIDLTIHDHVIRLTDTIKLGGDDLTRALAEALEITHDQAHTLKIKFGLKQSGLQPKILDALKVPLATICSEMRRVMKYYADRGHDRRAVAEILLTGGSAGLPGLVEYLATELSVPVRAADPWRGLEMQHLAKVPSKETAMYTTVLGLARLEGVL
jgi:type IV pilus assembly protein PilM